MPLSRRDFNKTLGAALAAFILARCRSIRSTTTAENTPTQLPTPIPSHTHTLIRLSTPTPLPTASLLPSPTLTPREYIRDSWLTLDELAKKASDIEEGEKLKTQLISRHNYAILTLERSHQIRLEVGDLIQAAYEVVIGDIWLRNAPITCYVIVVSVDGPPDYSFSNMKSLEQQAQSLITLQSLDIVSPDTLEKAIAAIEHDMAYLALVEKGKDNLEAALKENAINGTDYPEYEDLELPITADVIDAARFLVDVLGEGE